MEFFRNLVGSGKRSRKDRGEDVESDILVPQVETDPTTATVSKSTSGIAEEQPNPYGKYGLSSPPQGKNALDLQQAENLIKQDGFKKYLKKFKSGSEDIRDKTRSLVFLYGRGFYVTSKRQERKRKVKDILQKPKAIERCKRLLESEGADRDLTANSQGLYLQLCRTLHRYFQQEGSFGFLPNGNNDGVDYYFRIQRQGNCFMHSPCVMMPYLFNSRGIKNCYPVDLSKFVRRAFNDSQLYKYVVKDNGGHALAFLEMILSSVLDAKTSIDSYSYVTVIERDFNLPGKLKKYGPGLVTGFDCNGHFKNEIGDQNAGKIGYIQFQGRHHSHGKFVELPAQVDDAEYKSDLETTLEKYLESHNSNGHDLAVQQKLFPSSDINNETIDASSNVHVGEATAEGEAIGLDGKAAEEESHSMLLIGGRFTTKGKLWLLLQNWWDDMQLVEVDADYFAGSTATLSFVSHKKEDFVGADLDSFYTMNSSLVADSNNLDRADYAKLDGCFPMSQRDRY